VHGYYQRTVADAPADGRPVVLHVRVRRMRCPALNCPVQTFREQVPGVLDRYQRRTTRLIAQVSAVARELAGRASARLHVFTEDEDVAERILGATNSGDACVNDCSVHPLVPELPFGGVGNSGMGKYHGRHGFEAFTNARGVLYHSARIDPGVKYPPYSEHTREREAMQKLL
jgi:Aldehyde dehydrogenase family/zinc-finger of transposase IS204/IS1001/IS1096/IS1165